MVSINGQKITMELFHSQEELDEFVTALVNICLPAIDNIDEVAAGEKFAYTTLTYKEATPNVQTLQKYLPGIDPIETITIAREV